MHLLCPPFLVEKQYEIRASHVTQQGSKHYGAILVFPCLVKKSVGITEASARHRKCSSCVPFLNIEATCGIRTSQVTQESAKQRIALLVPHLLSEEVICNPSEMSDPTERQTPQMHLFVSLIQEAIMESIRVG